MKNARIIVTSILFFVSLALGLPQDIYAQSPSGDITVTTTTTWPVGAYQINSLTVESGATLTIAGGSSLQVAGGITVTGNSNVVLQSTNNTAQVNGSWQGSGVTINAASVQVDAGSSINADEQGYAAGAGPGGGSATAGNGGSYGGAGGYSGVVGAAVYGSSTNPVDLGSGGGYCCNGSTPGAGGGAVTLTVSGTLTNNGVISANGQNTSGGYGGAYAGGGAGGSVNITAATVAGTGTITATGGHGGAASGGGGRIALLYTTNSGFNLAQVTANAGANGNLGGAGTVYVLGASSGSGTELTVSDNMVVPGGQTLSYDTITVNDTGSLSFGAGSTVTANNVNVSGGGTLTVGGGSTVMVTNTLLVTGNSNVVLRGANSSAQVNEKWAGAGVTVSAGLVQVDAGSTINADVQGYVAEAGPGGGSATDSNGGSYGGVGGRGAAVYGSATNPVDLGSGGGYCCNGSMPGSGGGAIRLLVSGTLTNNGVISANGQNTSGGYSGAYAGAGAGGSVWVTAASLVGAGSFTANGGAGGSAGGGGGRIAIYYGANSNFTGFAASTATGGSGGSAGANGTVGFFDTSVTNANLNVYQDFRILQGTTATYNTITVQKGAVLTIGGGSQITVSGPLTVSGTLIAQSVNNTTQVNGSWQGSGVGINAASVQVDASGSINADSQGYAAGAGPGGGSATAGNGGSYGGVGGYSGAAGGAVYGSSTNPVDLGSGGGYCCNGSTPGAGGGAVTLTVTGTLTNNGVISANGQNASGGYGGAYAGGGAGGSVNITAATVAGTGTITATGGNGGAASGGGGRIALLYTTNSGFNLAQVTANAGVNGNLGGAGTVYVLGASSGSGTELTVSDNMVVPGGQMLSYDTITVNDTGSLSFGAGSTVTANNVNVSGGGTLTVGGGSTVTVTNTLLVTGDSNVVLQGANSSAQVNGKWAGAGVTISAGSVQVDAGSTINADGQGYVAEAGPGGGSASDSNGGSFGGVGGRGAAVYGSATNPVDLGSGGGYCCNGSTPGAGGGAVRLLASGTLTNNGVISANGGNVSGAYGGTYAGAGSGGSMWVTTGSLMGAGSFTANGGAGGAAGGGGGRIAIYYGANSNFTGFAASTATGGSGGNAGANGTVGFFDTSVANTNLNVYQDFPILPETTATYNTITVQKGAVLTISGGSQITVSGPLTVSGTLVAQSVNNTAQVNGSWQGSGVGINAASVQVDASGAISADGQGYVAEAGPGGGSGNNSNGGSYGGVGGSGGAAVYGSSTHPVDLGSGGGYCCNGSTPGAGGGAVTLTVGGTLTNNGVISANGGNAAGNYNGTYSGGGAGGSVNITSNTISGSGTITATGGNGGSASGGGGRIALLYTTNNGFNLAQVTANAGANGNLGGAGTVYVLGASTGSGTELTVSDNMVLPTSQTLSYDTITVNDTGSLSFGAGSTVTANNVNVSGGGTLTVGGGSTVTVNNTLLVTGNSNVVLQSTNNTAMVAGAWKGAGVTISAAKVQVDTGSTINADAQGYIAEAGPGGGSANDSNGGSYGGVGGRGAAVYGSATNPVDLGSGGGYCCNGSTPGAGGGAIRLLVSGTLTNNGVISANGGNAGGNYGGAYAGAGAGGSVNITANTIAGLGTITATGGNGGAASGGGGRVAVYYINNSGFQQSAISVGPGANGSLGTAGTITFTNQTQSVWLEPSSSVLHGQIVLKWFTDNGTAVNVTVSGPQTLTIVSGAGVFSSANWDTSTVPDGAYELRLVILDSGGNTVQEVTKKVVINNSVTWHYGVLTANQEWSASTVHALDGIVVIPSGVTLTIDPGTIVKALPGAEILVQNGGILNALGGSTNPVIFTTFDDCAHGGDTGFSGGTCVPVAGEWNGVVVQQGGIFNENSQTELLYLEQVLSGTLGTSQTLLSSFVYQVNGNLVVPNGASLTIQPGTVVKFSSGAGINVQPGAALSVNGTMAQPIYFTSIKDDSVGGDTNGDGSATTPAAGDWGSIIIDGATASFNHVQMRYGGGPPSSSAMIGMIQTGGSATVTVSNSILAQSFWDGILTGYPGGGDVVTVTSSVLDGIEGRAINAWPGSTVHVVNDTFDNDGVGIFAHGGVVDVANTVVSNIKGISGWGALQVCCGGSFSSVSYSDIWSSVSSVANYGGMTDLTGSNGNISANPIFVNELQGDYRLNYGSPAIDAGAGTVANYPLTDIMGDSRYTDPLVSTKTGIPDANGNYPDMGAYEFVQNAPSNIDMTVTSVTGPSSAMVGTQVQITWTDANIGSGTAGGPWHDSVYLVSGPNTNPVELFATQVLVGHGVVMGPGSTTTNTATIRVPGTAVGNYRWEVKTNTAGEIFEGQNTANNTGVSLDDVAIDVPALPVNGASSSNSFSGTGQSWWYKLEPGANQSVNVNLGLSSGGGSLQLFIGQGYVPTPQQFDIQQQQWNSASVSAVIPKTSTQTYYVTAYAQSLTSTPTPFSISAATQQFSLSSVQPNSINNNYPTSATIEFIGAQLSSTASYQLVSSNGTAYTASSVYFGDSDHVYATFAASKLAQGGYTAQVSENGFTASLSNAVYVNTAYSCNAPISYPDERTSILHADDQSSGGGTVTPCIPSVTNRVEYNLVVPEAVRAGFGGTVTIQYTNTSGDDVMAPLMTLVADQASVSFIAPQCSGCSPNFASLYTGMAGQGQLLGINQTGGPAGVLPAGATGSISLNFTPSISSSNVNFNLYIVPDAQAGSPINWSSAQDSMRPSYISNDAWGAIFANFTAQVGSTWGSYNAALAADATYLSQLGKQEYRVSDLQAFELMKAGVNTISQRYFLGAFGYGASHPFDIWGGPWAGGWLMHYPSGTVRPFVPNPNNAGQYTGGIGDYATMALQSDQSLLLTEKSGTIYHFIPNPNVPANILLDYIQDLNGNRITANYTNGMVTSATNTAGDTWTYTWNSQGRISQMADPVGRVANFAYDTAGTHLLSIAAPVGTTSVTYVTGQGAAEENAVQSITYPDGTHTYYQYDTQGRTIQVSKDGGAQAVNFAYDSAGDITVTDALGKLSQVSLDDDGAIAHYTDPLGNLTQLSFDPEEKLIGAIGPDGSSSSLGYDSNGNPVSNRDPLGHETTTQFAAIGDLLSLTDPQGNTTQYGYDSRYNATSLTYPNDLAEQGTYDPRGNLTSWTNRRGQTITYTYNGDNLLTQKRRSNGSAVTYAYDGHRNLQSVTDAKGTISFTYDAGDRLKSVTYPNGRFLQYTYDSGGRRSSMSDSTGFAVNYNYDSVGRLSHITTGTGTLNASYAYDADGRLSQKSLGNGAYTTYGYDAAGNLLHLVNYSSGSLVNSRFDYTYDASGRRTAMTTLNGTWQYGYDANGQLTSVSLPNGSTVQYSYDAVGNRASMVSGGATTSYNVNNLNQYTSVNGAAYGYDTDGNLTSKQSSGAWTYTYDDENKLTAVSGPSGNWAYQYDALGNRVAKISGTTTTQYLIDPTGIGSVVAEFAGSGKLLNHFTYGLDLASSLPASGSAGYYQFDGSANTAVVTGTGGAVLDSYSYLPFGEKVQSTVTVPNSFTYAGQVGIRDDGDGLYYMRARYYDPATGRFINKDPMGLRAGINLYAYANEDPMEFSDPTGKDVISGAITGAIYGAAGAAGDGWKSAAAGAVAGALVGGAASAFLPPGPATGAVAGAAGDLAGQELGNLFTGQSLLNINAGQTTGAALTGALGGGLTQDALAAAKAAQMGGAAIEWATDILNGGFGMSGSLLGKVFCGSSCAAPENPPGTAATGSSKNAHSSDPNGKMTVGYGDQGFIPPGTTITYTIYFENQASATAPAQKVVVTDPLDSNLDWSTVQLSQVGVNNVTLTAPSGVQSYSTQTNVSTDSNPVNVTAALNLSTGVMTWTMQSVDPTTGAAPANPMAGFLPPDNASHQGEGFVTFTVKPKTGLTNGTAIYNQATIIFDTNAAISTNKVTNTIDSVYPTSAVNPLPATTTTASFTVSWSGTDPGGAGIASYNIYSSTDGAPYTIWLAATSSTSATFSGALGHTYFFYSMATDNTGLSQQVAGAVQTTTTTVTQATPVITWATPSAISYGTALSATQLDATANVAGTFTYSPAVGTMLAAGSQTLSVTFTPVNTTNYTTATASVTLTVNQTVPVITWATPSAISYGTALSATQLDATTNVGGTFTYSPAAGTVLAAGSQTLSVTFTPANTTNYTTATASVALTVNQAAPSVTQQFASTQLVYPGATNVTVCVAGTKATPTGSIQIDAGSTVLTTLSLQGNGCGYWYISPGLNAGTYSITSVYSGDSNNPRGTSAPTVLTVSPVPVNMSASCWNASFPYGANYQCTVNVSSNAGSAQGNITYSYDSGAPVAVPLSGGSAQFTITEPPVGTQNVVIGYAQQTNYAAAQPQTENFTVTSAAVQVSLAPSTWYATVGTNITFSAAVASWSAGPPQNGSVSFYDGSTLLSTVPVNSSGQGSYTTSSLPAGSQTITAAYSGGANYASGSTGVTITLAQ